MLRYKHCGQEWVLGVTDGSAPSNPAVAASLDPSILDVRWLPHCSLQDLYEQYKYRPEVSSDLTASLSVFQRVWQTWKGSALQIRAESQHARCYACAKYCKFRQTAQTEGERCAVQQAYNEHLRGVFQDRDIGAALALASEKSTNSKAGHRVLYVSMDSMDQASLVCLCVVTCVGWEVGL